MLLRGVVSTRDEVRVMFQELEGMEDAARILQNRGVDAAYQNTGGGCMCIVVEDERQNLIWTFGFADAEFGFGLDIREPWASLSYGEMFEGVVGGTPAERLADIVQARMAGPKPDIEAWAYPVVRIVDGTEGIAFQTVSIQLGNGQTDPVEPPFPMVASE
jgi:hypothetical protein